MLIVWLHWLLVEDPFICWSKCISLEYSHIVLDEVCIHPDLQPAKLKHFLLCIQQRKVFLLQHYKKVSELLVSFFAKYVKKVDHLIMTLYKSIVAVCFIFPTEIVLQHNLPEEF